MYGTYCRLGVHVMDSDLEVIRRALRVVSVQHRHCREMREERHRFLRLMLFHHQDERRLYRAVMWGSLGQGRVQ